MLRTDHRGVVTVAMHDAADCRQGKMQKVADSNIAFDARSPFSN